MHGKFSVRIRRNTVPSNGRCVWRCARAARELCKRISVALPYLNPSPHNRMRVCYTCARAACIASCCVVRLSERCERDRLRAVFLFFSFSLLPYAVVRWRSRAGDRAHCTYAHSSQCHIQYWFGLSPVHKCECCVAARRRIVTTSIRIRNCKHIIRGIHRIVCECFCCVRSAHIPAKCYRLFRCLCTCAPIVGAVNRERNLPANIFRESGAKRGNDNVVYPKYAPTYVDENGIFRTEIVKIVLCEQSFLPFTENLSQPHRRKRRGKKWTINCSIVIVPLMKQPHRKV